MQIFAGMNGGGEGGPGAVAVVAREEGGGPVKRTDKMENVGIGMLV